jgi:hypothetical protein
MKDWSKLKFITIEKQHNQADSWSDNLNFGMIFIIFRNDGGFFCLVIALRPQAPKHFRGV